MKLIKIYACFITLFIFGSCSLIDPVDDNHSNADRIMNDPKYAEGVLASGYTRIPTNSYSFNDVATDDAVTNVKLNNYLRMATGQWTASFNPMNQWQNCLEGVQYVNHFLTFVEDINWRQSIPELNELYIKRFKGESHGLRALLNYHLLVTVAGEDQSGGLAGIPIIEEYLQKDADFNIPRATFAQSIDHIYADINKALEYLTMDDYKTISSTSELPRGYEGIDPGNYNIVFGREAAQRISGRILKGLKARVALLAASPLYNSDAGLWVKAAEYSGELLKLINGIDGLDPNGHRFYQKSFVDQVNITGNPPVDQAEMLWRGRKTSTNTRERANFPPSMFGSGNVNPTQNLVDAFPMQNGYPITDPKSGYDSKNPYEGRDPRLDLYILRNGSSFKSTTIQTNVGGRENAKDSISTSTRTGYYLKKLLVEQVNLNPTSTSTENHYEVHMRYTEFFLIYAEAANEVWGPDADPNNYGFTARDVIGAIRKRAGIAQPDEYLESIRTKDELRTLIRNERRLELCFEGFRFWDLRRWKENITEPARGVNINSSATEYNYVNVEQRLYQDYMYSGPVPHADLIKYNNLVQNKGW